MDINADFKDKVNVVKGYYEKIFDGYLLNDLRTMNGILFEKNNNDILRKDGNCAVPLAMFLFGIMSHLGLLTNIKHSGRKIKNSERYISECIKNNTSLKDFLIEQIFPKDKNKPSKLTDREYAKLLVDIYRNPFSHRSFCSIGTGISRIDEIYPYIINISSYQITLNPNKLHEIVCQIISGFKNKIDIQNDSFITTFYERLYWVVKMDDEKKKEDGIYRIFEKLDVIADSSMIEATDSSSVTTINTSSDNSEAVNPFRVPTITQ